MLGLEERLVERAPSEADFRRWDRRSRQTFSQVPSEAANVTEAIADPYGVLDASARVLEQWRGLAAIAEAVDLSGARTNGEVGAQLAPIMTRARLLARIDPLAAILSDPAYRESFKAGDSEPDPDERFPLTISAEFVRRVSSLIEFCPIEELVMVSERIGVPDLGHRCRLSYDWLKAFIRRHTPGERETLHILGCAYAEGRLSLDETANLLAMPRADAVAWLEEHSYARDLSVIGLDAEQEAAVFAEMRRERLNRAGRAHANTRFVVSDVLASQRIEGVDARPWIGTGV